MVGHDLKEGALPGISVFVITRNEEARLGRTLAALDWADQVVVVDSGSTDGTEAIARAAGAEFHTPRLGRLWPPEGPCRGAVPQ